MAIPAPARIGASPRDLLEHLPCLRDGEDTFSNHLTGSFGYYPQLYALTGILNPSSILEIGCFWGYSMCTMLQAAKDCRVAYSLDAEMYIPGDYLGSATHNIRSTAHPDCDWAVIRMNTHLDTLPEQVSGRKYDLIYIDGDHSYAGALADLELVWPLCAEGGAVLLDDTHQFPGVMEAIVDYTKDRGVRACLEVLARSDTEPRGLHVLFPERTTA